MVRHDVRIRLVVIQDGPVGGDPCDAEISASQPVKIVLPVEGHSLRDQLGLTPKLLELFICKMIIQKSRSETERYGQSSEKNEPDGTEYFAAHEVMPAFLKTIRAGSRRRGQCGSLPRFRRVWCAECRYAHRQSLSHRNNPDPRQRREAGHG